VGRPNRTPWRCELEEIAQRLWWWTAPHPDWTPEDLEGGEGWEEIVSSYAAVTNDELVLFDPLIPKGEEEDFWKALDDDVEHHGPPAVLITIFWHARSAEPILDRYEGASVWAYEPATKWVGERTRYTNTFSAGDALPGGIEAMPMHRAEEVAYWLPEHNAAVVGDTILRHGERATLFPPTWARRKQEIIDAATQAVRELMERKPDRLLLTHGGPTDPAALEV
jgi:glyoxylase-like metal-dependent hydrolase (beta-lactamase superfamily II)